ncbi:MAG: hypothetical protein HC843_01490 [Sphingomonadales bacterium]|nr:hypothetical protein [Sphingomonadales bacterium]
MNANAGNAGRLLRIFGRIMPAFPIEEVRVSNNQEAGHWTFCACHSQRGSPCGNSHVVVAQ